MTINNKSERNYRGKCLGWPVASYGGEEVKLIKDEAWKVNEVLKKQVDRTRQAFLCVAKFPPSGNHAK